MSMRKCDVYKVAMNEHHKRLVREFDYHAIFHEWGTAYEEFDTGPGNFSIAIVEDYEGNVHTPEAGLIKFTESCDG